MKCSYDDLHLVPSIVASRICELTYTGREMRDGHRQSFVAEIEKRRQAMTADDIRAFCKETDERCRAAYEAKADFFMMCVRSKTNRGRDQLYVWVTHWLSAFLGNQEPKLYA